MKEELIQKCSKKPITKFAEFDCLIDGGQDDFYTQDENGFALSSGYSYRLMNGTDVRILIRPHNDKTKVLGALGKLVRLIKAKYEKQEIEHSVYVGTNELLTCDFHNLIDLVKSKKKEKNNSSFDIARYDLLLLKLKKAKKATWSEEKKELPF